MHYTRKSERYQKFTAQFDHVLIEEKYFHRKSHDLDKFSRKQLWWGHNREENTSNFSIQNLNLLTNEQRIQHKIVDCQECLKRKNDIFSVKYKKRKIQPVPDNQSVDVPIFSPKKRKIEKFVNAAAETPFKQMIPKVTNLTPPKACYDKRRLTGERQRKYKKSIEDIFSKKRCFNFVWHTRIRIRLSNEKEKL